MGEPDDKEVFKKCSKCGHTKSLTLFAKDKHVKSGYRGYCKDCGNEARNQLYIKNKKVDIEKAKAYYHENKERVSAKYKVHYEENSEIIQVKNKVHWLEEVLLEPEFGYLNT